MFIKTYQVSGHFCLKIVSLNIIGITTYILNVTDEFLQIELSLSVQGHWWYNNFKFDTGDTCGWHMININCTIKFTISTEKKGSECHVNFILFINFKPIKLTYLSP